MKTPEEWINELHSEIGLKARDAKLAYLHLTDIQRIQQEAYHEGQLSGLQMGKETAIKTINEVFSKPAE